MLRAIPLKSGSFGRALCCSCPNIVFTMVLPLASFAEVGFVCGKCQRRLHTRTKPVSSAQDRRHDNLLTSHAKNKNPAQQAAPGFDHSSEGRSFMHESRFICKENLFRKICSAVSSCSKAKSQHPATEYLRPAIAVAVAARSDRSRYRVFEVRTYRRINQPRPEERACARLEGRPQAEIEPAAILRDGRMQACALLRMRPSRRRPASRL
jgi:hypothetical protein